MRPINMDTVELVIQNRGLLGASYARIWTTLGHPATASQDTMRNGCTTSVRHLLERGRVVRAGNQRVAKFIHRDHILGAATLLLGEEAMGRALRRVQADQQATLFSQESQESRDGPGGEQESAEGTPRPRFTLTTPENLTTVQEALVASQGLRVLSLSVGADLLEGIVGLTLESVAVDLEARGVGLYPLQVSR